MQMLQQTVMWLLNQTGDQGMKVSKRSNKQPAAMTAVSTSSCACLGRLLSEW